MHFDTVRTVRYVRVVREGAIQFVGYGVKRYGKYASIPSCDYGTIWYGTEIYSFKIKKIQLEIYYLR